MGEGAVVDELNSETTLELDLGRNLKRFTAMAEKLSAAQSCVEDFLSGIQLERAVESIEAARAMLRDGREAVAWPHVVLVAEILGKLQGWTEAREYFTAEKGVAEQMRKNGRKGGCAKGRNAAALRNKVIDALMAVAPDEGWPSIAKFDIAYHRVVQTVPGFISSDSQRRKVMVAKEIKKLIRTKESIRDDVVAALIKMAPDGGWATQNGVERDFDAASRSVADFKRSPKQYEMIMRRAAIKKLLPKAFDGYVSN